MEGNKHERHYKVEVGDTIIVYKSEILNNVYYKTMITKKNQDGTKTRFYKDLKFRSGVNLENKTAIKINSMFEDVRPNPKDKYNPIYFLVILDFEIVENPFDKNDAIKTYNNEVNDKEVDDSYFADVANENEIETPW